jgi:fatty acid desaturase
MDTTYFTKRSNAVSLTLIVLHLLVVVSPIYLAAALGPGWLTIACWLFFGLSANGILNLMHECAHLHVFKDRRGSDLLGSWLIAPFVFADFDDYRRRHWDHHRFIGREGETKDTYLIDVRGTMFVKEFVRCALVISAARRFFQQMQTRADNEPRDRGWLGALALFQSLFALSIVLTARTFHRDDGWMAALADAAVAYGFVYLYGLVSLTVFVASLRAIAEHQQDGDGSAASGYAALRNFSCGPLSRYLMGAYGFGEHYTHHQHPGIPYYHLPAATAAMARDNPLLRPDKSYFAVLKNIIKRQPAPLISKKSA